MNIEVRRVLEYKPGCNRIQFYIAQPNPCVFSLIQVEDVEATVSVAGAEILEWAGLKSEDTCFIYFVGITDEGEPYTFTPQQEVKLVDKDTQFVFKGVELCWESLAKDTSNEN